MFAPFLANSHPYLMKMNGKWSSPVIEHLTPADVLLLIATAAVLIFAKWRNFHFFNRLSLIVAIVASAAGPVYAVGQTA